MKSWYTYLRKVTFKDFTIEKLANNSNFWPYFWVIGSVCDEIWNNTRIQTGGSYFKIRDSNNIVQNIYGHSFLKYITNQKKMAKKLEIWLNFKLKNIEQFWNKKNWNNFAV